MRAKTWLAFLILGLAVSVALLLFSILFFFAMIYGFYYLGLVKIERKGEIRIKETKDNFIGIICLMRELIIIL